MWVIKLQQKIKQNGCHQLLCTSEQISGDWRPLSNCNFYWGHWGQLLICVAVTTESIE